MNTAMFAGRLGADAELRYTQAEDAVCGFRLAVDVRKGKDKKTLWVDCSLWGKRGEALAQYLTKGASVTVLGDVGLRQYEANGETRATLTCNVQAITLQGGGSMGVRDGDALRVGESMGVRDAGESRGAGSRDPARSAPAERATLDDDIPF